MSTNYPAAVAAFWLATTSWDDSFEVLESGEQLLVTQAGLDAVNSQAGGTDRITHSTILKLVAGGFPIAMVHKLVTERKALIDLVMRALANKDQAMVVQALALNPDLTRSALGTALTMAGQVIAGEQIAGEQTAGERIAGERIAGQGAPLLASAAELRATDPGQATEVAGLLTQIAVALPEGTLHTGGLAGLVAALGGS